LFERRIMGKFLGFRLFTPKPVRIVCGAKKLYCDGYTVGNNPSTIGGYVIADHRGKNIFSLEETDDNGAITNNEMELMGLFYACCIADNNYCISTDSKNNIYWTKRPVSKVRPDLMPLAILIAGIIREKNLKLIWEKRDKNLAGKYIEKKKLECGIM